MEAFLQFVRAAAPWVAAGLVVAILAVRGVRKKKEEEEREDDYGTEDMCVGMCFGLLIGTALGDNLGIGLSLGMLVGLIIGACLPKKEEK